MNDEKNSMVETSNYLKKKFAPGTEYGGFRFVFKNENLEV